MSDFKEPASKYYITKFFSYDSLQRFLSGQTSDKLKIAAMTQDGNTYTMIYYYTM